jgi:hypothetical protein
VFGTDKAEEPEELLLKDIPLLLTVAAFVGWAIFVEMSTPAPNFPGGGFTIWEDDRRD